jgi:hypothetical protein
MDSGLHGRLSIKDVVMSCFTEVRGFRGVCRRGAAAIVWFAVVVLTATGCEAESAVRYDPEVGDLLFQSSPRSPLVDAIEGASESPYSHVGMVIKRNGQWFVLESGGGGGVMINPLDAFIIRGRNGSFAAYRFDARYRDRIPAVIAEAEKFLGKPYDIRYEFDDAKIYCSELIFKGFKAATGEELGKVRKLGELKWQPYEELIRKLESGGLPLDRPMITPRDLSEAAQLRLVVKKGF